MPELARTGLTAPDSVPISDSTGAFEELSVPRLRCCIVPALGYLHGAELLLLPSKDNLHIDLRH